jgi:hypothetical protein
LGDHHCISVCAFGFIFTVSTVCDLEDIYLSPMMAPKRAASSKPSQDKTKYQRKMLTILSNIFYFPLFCLKK